MKEKYMKKMFVLFVGLVILLSSCSKFEVAQEADSTCGKWSIVENPWNGSKANVAVVKEIAEKQLGCNIEVVLLSEGDITYDAISAGSVDVVLEDWGLGRWQPWVDSGTIVEVGQNGIIGFVGMFVSPWMVEEYPDILDYKNLNKYSELFINSESDGKGAWYEGDPSYITIGSQLIQANSLNYKLISTGSEASLVELIHQAQKNKKPLLTYFAGPHPIFAEIPELSNSRVRFPESNWLDASDADGTTDYPDMPVYKLASKQLYDSNSEFAKLVKNFNWSNEDQNQVSLDLVNGVSSEDAAKKWIKDNKNIVEKWLR
jgi:glycine betaine/proline transport system substrate-binding protein